MFSSSLWCYPANHVQRGGTSCDWQVGRDQCRSGEEIHMGAGKYHIMIMKGDIDCRSISH